VVSEVLEEAATKSLHLRIGEERAGDTRFGGQWPVGVLVAGDLLAAVIALPLALILLNMASPARSNSLTHFWANVGADASFPGAIVLALAVAGFYRLNRRAPYESSFSDLKELAVALCAGCVISIALSLMVHLGFGVTESDSTQLLLAAIITLALITGGRAIIRAARRGVYSRVLIVGSDSIVERISTYLGLIKGVEVVGRVVDALEADDGSLGTMNDLPQLCEELKANRIVVAYPTSMSHESVAVLRSIPDSVHISIVPRYFELLSWRSRISDLYGLPLIEVAPGHLSLWDRFLKRGFDIAASSLLLLLLAPVALILAAFVKLSSPGPVLFRQERVGRGRRPFTILKFRTMAQIERPSSGDEGDKPHDESVPLHELRSKATEASRITRVGGVMRRTGLDEIPQFLNVLRGDMSLVGPRPFKECESETTIGWQSRRFEFRPGITGLWQVSGRNDLAMDDLRRLDYLYVSSWSLWWDIKIVWDTPRAMVKGFGAY
jgi:exopolysaccharide biosynthesis polyprenyl glycosylphosphotransferase